MSAVHRRRPWWRRCWRRVWVRRGALTLAVALLLLLIAYGTAFAGEPLLMPALGARPAPAPAGPAGTPVVLR